MKRIIEVPIGVKESSYYLSGFVYINVKLDMRNLVFLLDTGSSHTWLSEDRFKKDRYLQNISSVVAEKDRVVMFGVNGDVDQDQQHEILTDRFQVGGMDFTIHLMTVDFHLHDVDGILGLDFLLPNKAVIDLPNKKLLLEIG